MRLLIKTSNTRAEMWIDGVKLLDVHVDKPIRYVLGILNELSRTKGESHGYRPAVAPDNAVSALSAQQLRCEIRETVDM